MLYRVYNYHARGILKNCEGGIVQPGHRLNNILYIPRTEKLTHSVMFTVVKKLQLN